MIITSTKVRGKYKDFEPVIISSDIHLCQNSAFIRVDEIEVADIDKIREKLKIKVTNNAVGFSRTYSESKIAVCESVKYLRIPRFAVGTNVSSVARKCAVVMTTGVIHSSLGKSSKRLEIKYTGTPTTNQRISVAAIVKLYNSLYDKGLAGCTLVADAGQGKTHIMMMCAARVKCKTLIVVHIKNILLQTVAAFEKFTAGATIGVMYDEEKKDGDVVVAIVNTLMKDTYKFSNGDIITAEEYLSQFDFVIYDEVHLFSSEKRSSFQSKCQRAFSLGLTATPEEHEQGLDPIVWWNVGPLVFMNLLPGYEAPPPEAKFAVRIHKINYVGPPQYTKQYTTKTGMTCHTHNVKQLAYDPNRNNLICHYARELLNVGHNVLIFAEHRKHAQILFALLKDKEPEYDDEFYQAIQADAVEEDSDDEKEDASNSDEKEEPDPISSLPVEFGKDGKMFELMGGISNELLAKAKEKGKLIVTTYRYMSVGQSIARMTAMILGTMRKRYLNQIIGRITRIDSETRRERQVIDIVDKALSLKSQWNIRSKTYKECGYPIESYEVTFKTLVYPGLKN